MKKLMLVLAATGLLAGCAHDRGMGGTSDQNGMNYNSNGATEKQNTGYPMANTNGVGNPAQQ
jgi:hypothetical protein